MGIKIVPCVLNYSKDHAFEGVDIDLTGRYIDESISNKQNVVLNF